MSQVRGEHFPEINCQLRWKRAPEKEVARKLYIHINEYIYYSKSSHLAKDSDSPFDSFHCMTHIPSMFMHILNIKGVDYSPHMVS